MIAKVTDDGNAKRLFIHTATALSKTSSFESRKINEVWIPTGILLPLYFLIYEIIPTPHTGQWLL